MTRECLVAAISHRPKVESSTCVGEKLIAIKDPDIAI